MSTFGARAVWLWIIIFLFVGVSVFKRQRTDITHSVLYWYVRVELWCLSTLSKHTQGAGMTHRLSYTQIYFVSDCFSILSIKRKDQPLAPQPLSFLTVGTHILSSHSQRDVFMAKIGCSLLVPLQNSAALKTQSDMFWLCVEAKCVTYTLKAVMLRK